MATQKDVVVRLVVDNNGAFKGLQNVNNALENTAKKASGVSGELRKASTGVVGILNDLTGGMASKFMDMKDAIGGATVGMKGFKAALVSTGIGALVVALGLLVENWDKIKEAIHSASSEAHDYRIEAEKNAEASKLLVENLALEERYLRAIGTDEADIAKIRHDTTQQALKDAQAVVDATKAELDEIIQRTSGQRGTWGYLKQFYFGSESPEELTAKLNEAQKQVKTFTADIGEQNAKYMAAEDALWAGAAAAVKKQQEERARIAATYADKVDQNRLIEEEMATRTIELGEAVVGAKELQTSQIIALQNQVDANAEIMAERERLRDQENNRLKVQMAADSIAALGSLTESLFKNNEAGQKKAFATNKAFSLAQAIINTYQAVNAALTAGGNPAKLATGAQFVEAGIALTTGLASVVKIAKTKFDSGGGGSSGASGGGGGGGLSGGGSGGGGIPSPTAAIDFSFLNQRRPQGQPIQAYVLPGNVTSTVEAREKIENQSRL